MKKQKIGSLQAKSDSTLSKPSNSHKKNNLKAFVHPKRGDSQKWPSNESQVMSDKEDQQDQANKTEMALNPQKEEAKSGDIVPIPEEGIERALNSKHSSVSHASEVINNTSNEVVVQQLERFNAGEICRFLVGLMYIVIFIFVFATEEEMYKNHAVTLTLQVIELVFLAVFVAERLIDLFVKNKNPFSIYYSGVMVPVILVLAVWTVLDMIDEEEFRELGAYRFCRVILIILKFDETKFIIHSHCGKYLPRILNDIPELGKGDKELYPQGSKFKTVPTIHQDWVSKCSKEDHFCINSSVLNIHKRRDSYHIRHKIKDKVAKYDFDKELLLTRKTKNIMQNVGKFEFDMFELNKATNGNELAILSSFLLNKHNLFVTCAIDPSVYTNFILEVQRNYNEVAYHNKCHGADVCRLSYYYATTHGLMEKAKLSDLDLATLIIGGSVHDLGHQGVNNSFLIETQHSWALKYNDVSVCENHHVAAAFQIVKDNKNCNIFQHMSSAEYRDIRKKLTQVIISTDMALHNSHLTKMKEILGDECFDIDSQSNKTFLMEMCLHASDLSNPTKQWHESQKWACQVYEEFFYQGDIELELGIPVSAMTDRINTNIATAQLGFIDFVIKPTFEIWSQYLSSVKIHLDTLVANRKRWEEMEDEYEIIKEKGNKLLKRFNELAQDEPSNGQQNSKSPSQGNTCIIDDLVDHNIDVMESRV
ncbi:unnamed protein product [Moneuplotes crassus]|uniref:Phosphodiesterase n=1 Tax=Euplotes crassus TaxID=5936 RepID=A0AAD2DCT1_EUPCR|nr:unnamed protein product [Moneuplotes crassus]